MGNKKTGSKQEARNNELTTITTCPYFSEIILQERETGLEPATSPIEIGALYQLKANARFTLTMFLFGGTDSTRQIELMLTTQLIR